MEKQKTYTHLYCPHCKSTYWVTTEFERLCPECVKETKTCLTCYIPKYVDCPVQVAVVQGGFLNQKEEIFFVVAENCKAYRREREAETEEESQ